MLGCVVFIVGKVYSFIDSETKNAKGTNQRRTVKYAKTWNKHERDHSKIT